MDSVQIISRTPYSRKAVCLKQLLSLRVYKLQEDETTRGSLQPMILATNPAAAVVESSFPLCCWKKAGKAAPRRRTRWRHA